MKRIGLILMGLSVVGCAPNQAPGPEVIAHRGFWNTPVPVPHNSIAALRNAIDLGCHGSEFDVWVTADDVPVVFHDAKTENGIEIQNVTLDSLMRGAEPLANGERIPTLDEYLAAWDHAPTKLILELKTHRDAATDDRAAGVVLDHLKKFGVAPAEVEFIAFSCHAVRAFVDRRCGSPVAYLEGDLSPAEAREQLGAAGIDYPKKVLKTHPEWIAQAHDLGMTVNVWTVVTEEEMRHFIEAGVDYITTDAPDVLLNLSPVRRPE
jgi:glycerophosphoryl diester phosphodiesterase